MAKAAKRDARGMVTAELAVTILTAFALLTMMCWGIYLIVLQLRCVDVAASVARQVARDDKAAATQAKRDAPPGAAVAVAHRPGMVTVTVDLRARPLAHGLPTVPLHAEAHVVPEPEGAR